MIVAVCEPMENEGARPDVGVMIEVVALALVVVVSVVLAEAVEVRFEAVELEVAVGERALLLG